MTIEELTCAAPLRSRGTTSLYKEDLIFIAPLAQGRSCTAHRSPCAPSCKLWKACYGIRRLPRPNPPALQAISVPRAGRSWTPLRDGARGPQARAIPGVELRAQRVQQWCMRRRAWRPSLGHRKHLVLAVGNPRRLLHGEHPAIASCSSQVEHRHDPADTTCPNADCGQPMKRIGEDVCHRPPYRSQSVIGM